MQTEVKRIKWMTIRNCSDHAWQKNLSHWKSITIVSRVPDVLLACSTCNFIVHDMRNTSARQSDMRCLDAEGRECGVREVATVVNVAIYDHSLFACNNMLSNRDKKSMPCNKH